MFVLFTTFLGALAGVGVFAIIVGSRLQPVRQKRKQRLRAFRSRATLARLSQSLGETLAMTVLGAVLAFGGWYATGWIVAALLGLTLGVMAPMMWRTPRRRRQFINEIEAYSQWTEQIRDLVAASGSLFEAVTISAAQAPAHLRPQIVKMASISRTLGFPAGLDWFAAEMKSPFADRVVLGMKIAWDSGARVSEAFDSTARAMRAEVEMRRRNEVANARAWTQVLSILGVTAVSVLVMFVFNRGFFDPFGTLVGQMVLAGVGVLMFGNVYWVLRLSESRAPVRLLSSEQLRARIADLAAVAAASEEGDQ